MAAAKKVRATTSFVVVTEDGYQAVPEGTELDKTSEIVKAHPELLEELVEQTTAPGKRKPMNAR